MASADLSLSSAQTGSHFPDVGVETVLAEVDAWRDAGGTHISLATMGLGLDSADAHIDYLASVANALNLR